LKASILFPAFVTEYTASEEKALAACENNFNKRLEEASDLLDTDLTGFDFQKNNFLDDELKSQYISYIYSCSLADILISENLRPAFVSGYSMGIYAAFYYCGSVSFADGLLLVKNAWNVISGETGNESYGMGMIIGLEESDLLKMMEGLKDVEICNQNNKLTFIISGALKSIENVLASARNEGAMRANTIQVSKPYHSQFLKGTSPGFNAFAGKIPFMKPVYTYISSIDQKKVETEDDLREEVVRNLCSRMNWLNTMNYMISEGSDLFFECGAGDGLTRNMRFVEGDFKALPVAKLDKFLSF
jgi:malonyl CoA-acyl carrier protein transacylase